MSSNTKEKYQEFEEKAKLLNNLRQTKSLLHWDQEVIMPEKGIKPRSQQISTLSEIIHNKFVGDETQQILSTINKSELNEKQRANYREFKREFDRSSQIPTELEKEISETTSEAVDKWAEAREQSNFELFKPYFEKLVELKRRYAEEINPDKEPYKVLFKDYEPYIELDVVEDILTEVKRHLQDKLEEIEEDGEKIQKNPLKNHDFSEEAQMSLVKNVAEEIGFQWEKGVLETSTHPFTSGNQFDSRITVRFDEENLKEGLSTTIHETGHALYQLGLPEEHYGLPTGQARELSIHESQSRFWENHVGRSKEFFKYLKPELEEKFPVLEQYSVNQLYKGMNEIKPDNKIRVEADELTYHLHIILRFEIERKLVNGEIEVEDVPELWNNKMEKLLGTRPENDAEGCLQDIHWSWGNFGYFPTYSIGSILAAQIDNKIDQEFDKQQKIEDGEFEDILEWLRQQIHQHGQTYKTQELVEKVTGEKIKSKYFIEYIDEKYDDIYELGK